MLARTHCTAIVMNFSTYTHSSLVPRPFPAPVFDRLQYANTAGFAYCKQPNTGTGNVLATRLTHCIAMVMNIFHTLQVLMLRVDHSIGQHQRIVKVGLLQSI